ncbi:MAG: hypothetical protein J6S76_00300, partial [Clostridia bacterium]|nr:hypothetical protein [Clostridia bacterium]
LVNVAKNSFLIGGGRENIIENNIVVNSARVAMQYDDRNRDGYINDGWAWHHVLPHGIAYMWTTLNAVPYTEGVWSERYPRLAQLKTDESTDVNDPDHPINPSYSVVKNNVSITPSGDMFDIADSVYTFSEIEDFAQYATAEDAGWDAESFTLSADSPVFTDLPEFEAIPVEKIGRKK